MVKQLRFRDVLYLLVAGWLIIGMLKGICDFGRASPLDIFLLYFFAAAIAWKPPRPCPRSPLPLSAMNLRGLSSV